jgi:hypothetical protein
MKTSYRQNKILSFIFSAFSLISAFFSVFSLNTRLQYAVFFTTVLCLLVTLFFYIKVREHQDAVKLIINSFRYLPENKRFYARAAQNLGEVLEAHLIDKEVWGETAFSKDLLVSWWKAYPKGLIVLYEKREDGADKMIGLMGIWPIKKQTFNEILEGIRTDLQFSAKHISTNKKTYWYIGAIIVNKKYQRTSATAILLLETLRNWYLQVKDESSISICATAYSKDGENIIKRFGLYKFRDDVEGYPLYVMLDFEPAKLRENVSRVLRTAKKEILSSLQKGDLFTTKTTEITETKDNFIFSQR